VENQSGRQAEESQFSLVLTNFVLWVFLLGDGDFFQTQPI